MGKPVEFYITDRDAVTMENLAKFFDGIRALSARMERYGLHFEIYREAKRRMTVVRLEETDEPR